MTWTKKIPTVPGFYWCRLRTLGFVTEIRIKEGHAHAYGLYHQGIRVSEGYWSGPIPPPEDKR